MAKKRKASSKVEDTNGEIALDHSDARKKIKSYEDVADSDDEFHLNNDRIRLAEEPAAKRRRKWAEQEEFLQPSDEEVLGYSEDEASQEEDDELEDTERRKTSRSTRFDANGDEDIEDEEYHSDEDGIGWGTSKADLYGADAIETEEQALEEEAEALRLQKKQLQSMNAADYGFEEEEWQNGDTNADIDKDNQGEVVTEVLDQVRIAPDLGPEERLKFLKSRYPEFEFLSKDLLNLQTRHAELVRSAESSPVARIKSRALTAYIGALAMYFSLLTSTASKDDVEAVAMSAAQIRDHPLMDSLVHCRNVWTEVEKLSESMPTINGGDHLSEADSNEESESDSEIQEPVPQVQPQAKKSRAERFAEAAQAAREERKAQRLQRTEADLADLDNLLATSNKRRKTKPSREAKATAAEDSDLGEEVPLTAREAEDKAKRKKSLRFYTSQIAQKANKRGTAGRNAGGDDDIPHRERLRDRQARLNAEAEKRGQRGGASGDALGGDSDEEDRRQAREIRDEVEDNDYYDLVAARASKKKSDKAALAEAQRQAASQGGRVVQEEAIGEDGKRKISYAIEKNKGLTPHRKKDVRNPRVKKKKKFEEKKKKLASMKPVYKGGEGRGGYGGEMTGIKKGLVKSTKL